MVADQDAGAGLGPPEVLHVEPVVEPADAEALAAGAAPTEEQQAAALAPAAGVEAEVAERAIRFAHWGGWHLVHDEVPELQAETVKRAGKSLSDLAARVPPLAGWLRVAALAEVHEGLLALAIEEAELADRYLRGEEPLHVAPKAPIRIGGVVGWLRDVARRRLGVADGGPGADLGPGSPGGGA